MAPPFILSFTSVVRCLPLGTEAVSGPCKKAAGKHSLGFVAGLMTSANHQMAMQSVCSSGMKSATKAPVYRNSNPGRQARRQSRTSTV